MASTTSNTPPSNLPSSSKEPTESEILIRDFLAANPVLDSELGEVQVMTDRYTNAEWAQQIKETQRKVLKEVEERRNEESRGWNYEVPEAGSWEFAKTVDHTLLKLGVREAAIDALCSEARTEGFKSVCVRLPWVQRCVSNLKGSDVVVACVVGFHEGTQDTYSKLREARAAVAAGAAELDIVINHSILTRHNKPSSPPSSSPPPPLISRDSTTDSLTAANTAANSRPRNGTTATEGPYSVQDTSTSTITGSPAPSDAANQEEPLIPDYSTLFTELASLRALCPPPVILKLILETSALTPPQILAAAHLAAAANFDYIKTSTGFSGRGATLDDVQLMVTAAEYLSTRTAENGGSPLRSGGRVMRVKASGGIRDLEGARAMLGAGAGRLGTSSGVWIMQEGRRVRESEKEGGRPGGGVTRLYTDDSVSGY